jgi:hypothetical protein
MYGIGEACSLYGEKRNTHVIFVGKEKYTLDICVEKRNTHVMSVGKREIHT